jgi:hypothetical protein
MEAVWAFNGNDAGVPYYLPSAVFSCRQKAEEWIARLGLSGLLTCYPLDVPAYDWARERGYFKPQIPDQKGAPYIQRFSSAHQEHYMYVDGKEATG